MDGFEQNHNVLIIGATNHEDSLDSAATRPGRFDKKIPQPNPGPGTYDPKDKVIYNLIINFKIVDQV
jgi:ATP-dependent 26S proteasome regulatory subunit